MPSSNQNSTIEVSPEFSLEGALVESSAFRETPEPVLGTSGTPLFYFVNTEKLLPDGGKWETFGEDSASMIYHACGYLDDSRFGNVIRLLAKQILDYTSNFSEDDWYISGFQRRDWVFSGPVAKLLNKPHLSVYKDGRTHQIEWNGEKKCNLSFEPEIREHSLIHVSDLLTKGSSAVGGWIPLLQKKRAKVRGFFNIVDRMEGGRENIAGSKIPCFSLFELRQNWLKAHTKNHETCVGYFQNPEKATREYLQKYGALAFLPFFDPNPSNTKRKRAMLFWKNWSEVLSPSQKQEFESNFFKYYGMDFSASGNDIPE